MLHHLMDSAAARGILARQGVGRIRHLSCRILRLQQLVKQRSKIVPSCAEPELFHFVSGVSGSDNVSDLGTKRLGKSRLSELMHYCGLGYIIGEMFVPFNEEAFQVKQTAAMIRTLKKGSASIASILAHASLVQSALGHMDDCWTTNPTDGLCVEVVTSNSNSWSELLPTMFVTLVVLATGFAFYKWLKRDSADDSGEDLNMATESHEEKMARYSRCDMSEVSEPDLWMQLHHFETDPLADDEADGGSPLGSGEPQIGFEDWHMNHEIALLMVIQKFLREMNTLGRIASWQAMWQLKQLLEVGVLGERRGLIYAGLKAMKGDYTAFLDDDTFRAVYKARGTYREDWGDFSRLLTRRYLISHGFDGENYYKEILEFLRDLDFDDLEARQLARDRANNPSARAEEEVNAARERAIATLEHQILLAYENNDVERVHWLQGQFDHLYLL